MTRKYTTGTQWKLRRLADRAELVLDQHKGEDVNIAAYEEPLMLAVGTFRTSYDQLHVLATQRSTELSEGKSAVGHLYRRLRGWVALVDMNENISGFDPSQFGDNPGVMDDVIAQTKRFVEIVEQHQDKISNSEELLADLGQALETAKTEWTDAQQVRKEYRTLVEQNRDNAARLHNVLIAFRKTLAQTIGRAHPSYQKLRMERVTREGLDAESDEALANDPAPPEPPVEATGTDG